MEKSWKVVVDKLQHEIKIKGDDSLQRPIARIERPSGDDWMENESWYQNAMEKATLAAAAPELLEQLQSIIDGTAFDKETGLIWEHRIIEIEKVIKKSTV